MIPISAAEVLANKISCAIDAIDFFVQDVVDDYHWLRLRCAEQITEKSHATAPDPDSTGGFLRVGDRVIVGKTAVKLVGKRQTATIFVPKE